MMERENVLNKSRWRGVCNAEPKVVGRDALEGCELLDRNDQRLNLGVGIIIPMLRRRYDLATAPVLAT